MILSFFSKIDVGHIVLDQKKNSKNILEKAFSYILSGFFHNLDLVSKNFKNGLDERWKTIFLQVGYVGYKKVVNFMPISKILICHSNKMLATKVKIKNSF